MQNDQAFLDYIIKALVDSPSDVEIIRTVDEMGVLLRLRGKRTPISSSDRIITTSLGLSTNHMIIYSSKS